MPDLLPHDTATSLVDAAKLGVGAGMLSGFQWLLKKLPSRSEDAAASESEATAELHRAEAQKTTVEALAIVIDKLQGQVNRLTEEVMALRREKNSLERRVDTLTRKIQDHGLELPPSNPPAPSKR